MGKVKKHARKVYTPGSRPVPSTSPGPGRPRKEKKKAGFSRVGNYRTKYRPQDLLKAIQAVREKRMGAREVVLANPFLRLSSSFASNANNLVGKRTKETVFAHTVKKVNSKKHKFDNVSEDHLLFPFSNKIG